MWQEHAPENLWDPFSPHIKRYSLEVTMEEIVVVSRRVLIDYRSDHLYESLREYKWRDLVSNQLRRRRINP